MELVRRKRRGILPFVIAVVFIYTSSQMLNLMRLDKSQQTDTRLLKNVIVHLDLKGSPPKISYLISLMPTLKSFGVTGFLVEYEDTFPYAGDLELLNGNKCYTAEELKQFLIAARDEGLMIIPLIQTFGHMEFVLKFEGDFGELSESTETIDSICPSKPASLALINKMLNQVINFHNEIAPLKYLHVGCDEVFSINICSDCLRRNLSDLSLFQDHVVKVTNMVRAASPETTILIWDDMMRGKVPGDITIKGLPIEPVSWHYGTKLKWLMHTDLHNYHKQFGNIWIASAFKGADGPRQTIPTLINRYRNHFSWFKKLLEYEYPLRSGMSLDTFHGIILTGWSRYAHGQPLCELLPIAYPSLILNLITIQTFKDPTKRHLFNKYKWPGFFEEYAQSIFMDHLKCTPDDMDMNDFDAENCSFVESKAYADLQYHQYMTRVVKLLSDNADSYVHNETYLGIQKMEINNVLQDLDEKIKSIKDVLSTFTHSFKENLAAFYNDYIVFDYVNNIAAYYYYRLSVIPKIVLSDADLETTKANDAPGIEID